MKRKILEMYDIRSRDIDPDTGYTTNDNIMYVAFEEEKAQTLVSILKDLYKKTEKNPNREIYYKRREILF